ncbi:lactate racemase domain-containing protein [Desulfosporosinus metallidurans]|uniref:Iron-sulfur cluster binding protein n=1 Tax=Desulfosporosinus metallidurans TaxID=1888891 RepID=A0A1Q8QUI0_9FIRM|nr:lactate racemase domain-containing protein [Desulfosporosinus metallidurans]OLN30986.1 Iron-sulfur cluster binding protein [Desulfosporosinus metallidurans]
MGNYAELLQSVTLPRVARIRQTFPDDHLLDIPQEIREALKREGTLDRIHTGDKVALSVGSRGINNLPLIVQTLVAELRKTGAEVTIIPAMGSHGGATAEGQQEILLRLGIVPEAVGAEIKSNMDVKMIGRLQDGLPVYLSEDALEADHIVLLNRIKPHTAFRGPIESGLVKMLTIGLGKQKGAEACHERGFKYMAQYLIEMGTLLLEKTKVTFGLGIIENAYDQTHSITAIPAEHLLSEEPNLLMLAKNLMPSLPVKQLDVLVVDEIGKDISGDGMDPNVTGRYPTPYAHGGPEVSKMALLDLTERSHGNANGIGTADLVAKRLVDKMDLEQTYPNALTSTVTGPVKIPLTLDSDYDVLRAAVKTCNADGPSNVRLVRIKNTLSIGEFWASEAVVKELSTHLVGLEIGELEEWKFNEAGNLMSEKCNG